MRCKLIVEGKEFDIDILDPELQKLIKPEKKTGYEKVGHARPYFSTYPSGKVDAFTSTNGNKDNEVYEGANYYSDKIVAENNARADKLMRQLRRFAVEHRKSQLCWIRGCCNAKWSIIYDCNNELLRTSKNWDLRKAFAIYFDSEEAANFAIETFRDELIWYFTEYKDSL